MKPLTKLILRDIVDYCGCTGLMMKESKVEAEYTRAVPIPISLFPCNIPQPFYKHAITVQPSMNMLIDKISRDYKMIHDTLKPYTEGDEFLLKLLEVSSKFHSSKHQQEYYLGIVRSDYMLDYIKHKLQMVEYNTIASSFGVLSDKLNSLQRFIYKKYPQYFPTDFQIERLAPPNDFIENATKAFNDCLQIYRKQRMLPESSEVYIAVIIQEGERNVYDQKPLEFSSFMKYNNPSIRLTLKEVFENGKVNQDNGVLKM